MIYPDYNPQTDTPPLDEAELLALDEQLAALPADAVMNTEALDGFLTGLLLGPGLVRRLPSAAWLPLIWGGDGPGEHAPFESNRQRKKAVVQVLRHLRSLDLALHQKPDEWQPIFSVAEVDDCEWVDASDWCTGFLQAIDLDREAWGTWLDNPLISPALVPLVLLGSSEDELKPSDLLRLEDQQVRDELSRSVPDAVLTLLEQSAAQAAP